MSSVTKCGYTALQRASCEGHIDIVRQLIKHSANVDHQDDQHGNTALHEAAWKGYSQTAEALVRAKANVYIKNKGGFAPLHLACQNGHNQTCRILLLAGCKPDIKNNYGDTPLHTAARYGHAGVTRILLSARSHVAEMNKNGDTALHIAAAMGRRKLTKILLESGASQTIKNKQNETPGDIAKRKEFNQILEILKNPPPVVSPEERLRREQEQKKKEEKEKRGASGASKDRGKGDKKRGKTNDSGTSSKDSSTRAKEKKKHKTEHKEKKRGKQVQWSPYGCQYYPPISHQDLAIPNIDSLPNDPLGKGEQYFIDLAGNIKKGPVGVGYTCYCAPFFKNVEDKLEKDKVALMDHIDAAHDKLDAKITNLEHRTKSHIQHLSDNVKQKLADEKEECRQRVERTKAAREAQADSRIAQLQQWVERRLSNRNSNPQVLPRSLLLRGSMRRPREPPPGHYPLSRSRSEEAISEYREEGESDRDSVYKGLRVLDHPTSMYNIPQKVHDEHDTFIYDSPKAIPSLVPGALRCPSPTDHPSRSQSADSRELGPARRTLERRSHSLDARNVLESSEDLPNRKTQRRSIESPVSPPARDVLNESASSDLSGGLRGSRSSRGLSGSSMHGSPVIRRMGRYSPAHPSPLLRHPDLSTPVEASAPPPTRPSHLHHTDLNQAVDNLRVSQSHAENGAIPKTTVRSEEAHCTRNNEMSQAQQPQGWSGYSRYDYRNNNPYMHGDLRGHAPHTHQPQVASALTDPTPVKHGSEAYMQYPKYPPPPEEAQTAEPYQPQPHETYHAQNAEAYYSQNVEAFQGHGTEAYHTQTTEEYHNQSVETYHAQMAQAQEDYDAATYLDMDRYRIQQAVKRLYDGYLAEGRLEAVRGGGARNPHESSTEHDSHNDSGYSTRLCTGSQGPSPALSGGHEHLAENDMRQHMGGATPDAVRCKPFGDAPKQDLSRGSVGDQGKAPGAEEGYPVPPVLRYNGLPAGASKPMPGAAPKFSTPNLSDDTIIIGESSLV
ncbi:uncharacterized protein LOC135111821 [Scylla paramamosain]|uniref:uncharacterized protein LOC135111821 n=1 Tax=Scylla paramamosain TaxID=85552 RepID=UPI0030834DE2